MAFRLETFGGLCLRAADGSIVEHVQRRRMALLALLAADGGSGMSRDKLLAHLWPERDDEHARALLRQALHALRRDFGAPELFLGTSDVRLNPQLVTSDVGEFRELLHSGALERAIDLYAGRFLDGIHVAASAAFDRWAEAQRADLDRRAARALETLAAAATARRDPAAAARWWGRLAAMDPSNAWVTVALMEAMAAAGNPAGALRQARIHETVMREEFGAEAHPDVRDAAERIRRAPPRSTRRIR